MVGEANGRFSTGRSAASVVMATAAGSGVTPTSTECEQQKQSSAAGDGTVSRQGVFAEQLADVDENLSASRAHQPTFARSAAVQVKKKTTKRRANHECFSRSTPLRLARRRPRSWKRFHSHENPSPTSVT